VEGDSGFSHRGGARYARVESLSQAISLLELTEPEAIFHGAGSADVRSSFSAPRADLEASVGTVSLWLEAARVSGLKPHFIFPSSAAVYGAPDQLPITEQTASTPISPYGMHKRMGEMLALQYLRMHDVPATILRLFSVYGPKQRRLLVWELFTRLQSENALELQGTGAESRDYLHQDDVAAAVLAIASYKPDANQLPIYNLASGEETSVLQMATALRDAVAPQKEIHCKGVHRMGDPPRWWADVSRIQSLLPDWRPRSLRQGLTETLRHWQGEPS
jgi:UDP-glucose 4-epimerase